ncbi:hypothetical protein Hanom_Chr17g01566741 [Helianthus anomalus]
MHSVDIQLWRLQNETWSKVVSFVPRVFMPLMIGLFVHYIDGNNKLIIVHEWSEVPEINVTAKDMHGFFPIIFTQCIIGATYIKTIVSPHV